MPDQEIRELSRSATTHCHEPFGRPSKFADGFAQLPYHSLGGKGLERLCFQLLLADGFTPRYFGKSGQAQYGVDLVVSRDGVHSVFQCKNLGGAPTSAYVHNVLKKFEDEWLGSSGLPRPRRFVLVCPQPLEDLKANEDWTMQETDFHRRTGVDVEFWDRNVLDERLRRLPDVVADSFSDAHVLDFCGSEADQWQPDLFLPLREEIATDRRLTRYFDRQKAGRVYIAPAYQEKFDEILDREPELLIRGLPGTGKTVTGLALAQAFQAGRWRVYYLDVRSDDVTEPLLLQGIRRRLSRRTIFVLDNCHEKPDVLGRVSARLSKEFQGGKLAIIYLSRFTPAPTEDRDDEFILFEERQAAQAVVTFKNTPDLFAAIIERANPQLGRLSNSQIAKILGLTGQDLFILDEFLQQIQHRDEIDSFDQTKLYTAARRTYFGGSSVHLPTVVRLAALAQFEIAPPAALLDDLWKTGEQERVDSLTVTAGSPPCWYFLHSSAAELVLHALTEGPGVVQANQSGTTASALIDYFSRVQTLDEWCRPDSERLRRDFGRVLRTELKLLSREPQTRLTTSFLSDESTILFADALSRQVACFGTLVDVIRVLRLAQSPAAARYGKVLEDRVRETDNADPDDFGTGYVRSVVRALRSLDEVEPVLARTLQDQINAPHFIRLIASDGTVVELFSIIQHSSLPMADDLIKAIDETTVESLTQATIDSGRSVATLQLTLFELGKSSPQLRDQLQQNIGAARFLRLIASNGTVFELFSIIKYSSLPMAEDLINALDETTVESLTQATIESGRSVGTLDLTLFELGKSAPLLRDQLEQKIGVARMWNLYVGNGSLRFLSYLMQHVSNNFRKTFVAAATNVSHEQWRSVLLSGSLWDLARFLTAPSTRALSLNLPAFERAVVETAQAVTRRSNWYQFGGTRLLLKKCSDSPARDAIEHAMAVHLNSVNPDSLECESPLDAVNAINCLWRGRPDLRSRLDETLRRLTPSEKSIWQDTDDNFEAARILLGLLRRDDFDRTTVDAYMPVIFDASCTKRFAKSKTINLFLYYWNALATWHERVSTDLTTFRGALPDRVCEELTGEVGKRAARKRNQEETANLLALTGLLEFLGIDVGETIRQTFRQSVDPMKTRKQLARNTFVPAFFSLRGLGWVYPEMYMFPKPVRDRLVAAVDDYTDVTPSVDYLRKLVISSQ